MTIEQSSMTSPLHLCSSVSICGKYFFFAPSRLRGRLSFIFGICALLLAFCVARAANPIDKSDPEVERQALKVADGFEINLFAADPMIRKPIEMNFDADGRLWVASSITYPQIKPGQQPQDQVVVLEDTTGSGHADKATVFADKLF